MSSQIDDKGFIRKVAFLAIISAFTVSITGCSSDEAEDNEMARKAIEERLAPVATVAVAGKSADDASAAPAAAKSGADIVASACAACHTTGVANAPKIGDNAAWQPRFDTGMDALMNSALNGKGAAMPARGGNPALTDDEIKAAVVHMLTESGIDADAPAAPAAAPEVPAEPAMLAAPAMPAAAPAMPAPAAPAMPAPAPEASATAGPDLAKGEAVYKSSCLACHGMGIAGAPKLGDANAWSARIPQGLDVLTQHAITGFAGSTGFMPAKGGNTSIPDADIAAAVAYMVSQSQ